MFDIHCSCMIHLMFQDADADGSPTDLHELFHIGQFVPTVVKALDSNKHGYKKISLSMDPKDLNANYKSGNLIEDMVNLLLIVSNFILRKLLYVTKLSHILNQFAACVHFLCSFHTKMNFPDPS